MEPINNTVEEKWTTPILYETPGAWFESLYDDISKAKKLIYIEIYRLNNDAVGRKIIRALSAKCKEGLEVKLLLDSWGTPNDESFFEPITLYNGEVKFFEKMKFSINYFKKNHQRNHRKIVVIDNHILHFGSANITEYSSNWRETILRMEDPIALTFKRILLENWRNNSLEFFKPRKALKTIKVGDYTIIRDIPSIYVQKIKKHFEKEIKRARKSVTIVTPYFLPGYKLRRQLILSSRRGVDITVYVPHHSDVQLVDYLRDKYLGFLHQNCIRIYYFQPANLHAKVMLVDSDCFTIGSSNFDSRSFRYMHEIMMSGKNPYIVSLLDRFIGQIHLESLPFNYQQWKNRSNFSKIIGWLLLPFRHFF